MSKNGGPAFPGPYADEQGKIEVLWKQHGMTLRDYFAAAALQGRLADHTADLYPDERARDAYELADAMLEARSK